MLMEFRELCFAAVPGIHAGNISTRRQYAIFTVVQRNVPLFKFKVGSEIREQYLYQEAEGVIEWKSKWRGTSQFLIVFHCVLVDYINEKFMKKLCTVRRISRRIAKEICWKHEVWEKNWENETQTVCNGKICLN